MKKLIEWIKKEYPNNRIMRTEDEYHCCYENKQVKFGKLDIFIAIAILIIIAILIFGPK